MRFKAKLTPEHVALLHGLVTPLSRLAGGSESTGGISWTRNASVISLDDLNMKIACKGKSSDSDGIICYAELAAKGGIFLEHRIESAAENNQIVMELDLSQLKLALKSVMSSDRNHKIENISGLIPTTNSHQYTVIKLAKRQNIPCLCIDACTTGKGSGQNAVIHVHHAIPLRILRQSDFDSHLPPMVPLPDVQLDLEPDKPLRVIIDRLKGMSPNVYLEASRTGELTVRIHTDGASIRAFYSKLTANNEGCKEGVTSTTVKVDTKKLSSSLLWQQQPHLVSSALLCFVENEMIVIHASLNPVQIGFFTYYVPVHYLSSDLHDD